jgi:hypothetical protein
VAEPVVANVVQSEGEAELVLSLLRGAGIECAHRMSNRAAGAYGVTSGVGPYEILVHAEDLEAAREVLSAMPEPE